MLKHFLQFSLLYENTKWFFFFYLWETLPYARKQDIFFVFFLCNLFFGTFQRKSGILIPDLYLYSIDIQTNIKLKFDKKITRESHRLFERIFGIFLKLFLNWVGQAQFFFIWVRPSPAYEQWLSIIHMQCE